MWLWFQRVLLGTLLERFGAHGVAVDASTLVLGFDEDSLFRYPALDNKLRFVGSARATLLREVPPGVVDALQADLDKAWPDLVQQMQRIPVPDRLTVTRNKIALAVDSGTFELHFDLVAD